MSEVGSSRAEREEVKKRVEAAAIPYDCPTHGTTFWCACIAANPALVPDCHAGKDGDCTWAPCPQLRDGEPDVSGRHCPLDSGGPPALPEGGGCVPGTATKTAVDGGLFTPAGRTAVARPVVGAPLHVTVGNLFHRLWTKAVGTPGYRKAEWRALEDAIVRRQRWTAWVQPASPPQPAPEGTVGAQGAEGFQLGLQVPDDSIRPAVGAVEGGARVVAARADTVTDHLQGVAERLDRGGAAAGAVLHLRAGPTHSPVCDADPVVIGRWAGSAADTTCLDCLRRLVLERDVAVGPLLSLVDALEAAGGPPAVVQAPSGTPSFKESAKAALEAYIDEQGLHEDAGAREGWCAGAEWVVRCVTGVGSAAAWDNMVVGAPGGGDYDDSGFLFGLCARLRSGVIGPAASDADRLQDIACGLGSVRGLLVEMGRRVAVHHGVEGAAAVAARSAWMTAIALVRAALVPPRPGTPMEEAAGRGVVP